MMKLMAEIKIIHAAIVLANEDGRKGTYLYFNRNHRSRLKKLVGRSEQNLKKFNP